ncbi:MAG: undecaprenyl-diphosphate phosphatase, partial [Clostridiales bacterium]|nr:undecaprenyl-diphosphate phosphatase [Clostridiales bacterium]
RLLSLLGYQAGDSALTVAVMLHLGTLIAVAAIFWIDWLVRLLLPVKYSTLLLLFLASLPALAAVILLGDTIDGFFSGWFLGISFLFTAAILVIIQRVSTGAGRHSSKNEQVRLPQALTMGLFQAFAILPGVSRSGSTLLGGVSTGLSRRTAAKFSFMMSAPAILGSFIMEAKDAIDTTGLSSLFTAEALIGVFFAAISGFLAIRYMLKLIERISFYKFAVYVFIVAIAVIIMQLTGFAGFAPIAFPVNTPLPLVI